MKVRKKKSLPPVSLAACVIVSNYGWRNDRQSSSVVVQLNEREEEEAFPIKRRLNTITSRAVVDLLSYGPAKSSTTYVYTILALLFSLLFLFPKQHAFFRLFWDLTWQLYYTRYYSIDCSCCSLHMSLSFFFFMSFCLRLGTILGT